MRTTLDIDSPILEEIRRLQGKEGGSMGAVVSRLLAEALAREGNDQDQDRLPLAWISKPMKAQVDLEDKDAIYARLDESTPG